MEDKKICGCSVNIKNIYITKYIKEKSLIREVVWSLKKFIVYFYFIRYGLPERLKNKVKLYKKSIDALSVFKSSSIGRCEVCGYISVYPLPTDEKLDSYYKKAYFDDRCVERIPIDLNGVKKRSHYQFDLLKIFISISNIKHVLDFGAGQAEMCYLLKSKIPDLQIHIVEPDVSFQNLHKRLLNAHCMNSIEELAPDKKYSLVFSSHSLEHVSEPIETLKLFNHALERDGLLFIEVPNANKDFFDNYRTDAPHISFFTIDSLRMIAEKAGLKTIHLEEYGLPFHMYPPSKNIANDYIEQPRKDGWSIRAVFQKI
jgi:hypothetical protein